MQKRLVYQRSVMSNILVSPVQARFFHAGHKHEHEEDEAAESHSDFQPKNKSNYDET